MLQHSPQTIVRTNRVAFNAIFVGHRTLRLSVTTVRYTKCRPHHPQGLQVAASPERYHLSLELPYPVFHSLVPTFSVTAYSVVGWERTINAWDAPCVQLFSSAKRSPVFYVHYAD